MSLSRNSVTVLLNRLDGTALLDCFVFLSSCYTLPTYPRVPETCAVRWDGWFHNPSSSSCKSCHYYPQLHWSRPECSSFTRKADGYQEIGKEFSSERLCCIVWKFCYFGWESPPFVRIRISWNSFLLRPHLPKYLCRSRNKVRCSIAVTGIIDQAIEQQIDELRFSSSYFPPTTFQVITFLNISCKHRCSALKLPCHRSRGVQEMLSMERLNSQPFVTRVFGFGFTGRISSTSDASQPVQHYRATKLLDLRLHGHFHQVR